MTGGTGFLGTHLRQHLREKQVRLCVASRRDGGDITKRDEVRLLVEKSRPDVIIHLATEYHYEPDAAESALMLAVNLGGVVNLLEAAREAGLNPFFINTGSCFVYAENRESVDERAKTRPNTFYALTKLYAEEALDYYSAVFGVRAVSLRLFTPYGPGDHARRVIPQMVRALKDRVPLLMTSGEQRWDFIHVDDICRAYLSAIDRADAFTGHEIFNIGSGRAVKIRNIASRLEELAGVTGKFQWGKLPLRRGEVMHYCADIRKASEQLAWHPEIDLMEQGLKGLVS